jgi:uncharacterized protein YgbK (DUF1537 family)
VDTSSSKLLLTFYGDDFTGSTDALEQLTLAGIIYFTTVTTAAGRDGLGQEPLKAL